MNFFENVLRNLFANAAVLDNPVFVGRLCFCDVGKDLRARIEFVCPEKWDRFSALKVTIMNRASGALDSVEIAFRDVWGADSHKDMGRMNRNAPYIWVCDDKIKWLPNAPSSDDYEYLRGVVRDYVDIFRSREERNEKASLDDKIRIAAICVMDSGLDNSNKAKDFEIFR